MTPERRFATAIHDIFADAPPRRVGLAVSGGGDSMALMHLARGWARDCGAVLSAATVDHGLRPEAAAEAQMVADGAGALGIPHATLRWGGWDGAGNLQDTARQARRKFLEEWAAAHDLDAILTGHTMDDQAETVLLRLSRGSGVDGLGGIAPARRGRPTWARPLLALRRAELREWLARRGVTWIEDPSNEDTRFDRVRARAMLDALSDLGLTVDRLDRTAHHMRLAREVLDAAAQNLVQRAVTIDAGDLLIALDAFRQAAAETRTRLLAAGLQWVSGAAYRARYAAVERLSAEEAGVLQGCLVTLEPGRLRIARELAAVREHSTATHEVWDGRWQLDGPHAPDLRIAALAREGLRHCADWRASGLPATSLHSSPAVWRGDQLVAAPVALLANGWRAKLLTGRDVFSMLPIMR